MHSNITQRLGERLIHKKQNYSSKENAKSINEELLQMVANIRSLEDQLMAEQYRQQLLLQQNEIYNSKLEKLNSRNDVQRQRIAKLEEEYEVHKVKNNEMQLCEESLRAIYEEVRSLTKIVEARAEACERMSHHKNILIEENDALVEENFELKQSQNRVYESIQGFIMNLTSDNPKYDNERPTLALKTLFEDLQEELMMLQSERKRIHRQGGSAVTFQKETIIKLQFEIQLLRQRAKDEDKIEKLSAICASQQSLQSVVEQMLIKEDQLLDYLSKIEQECASNLKKYKNRVQRIKSDMEGVQLRSLGQIKELQMQISRAKVEVKQIQTKIAAKTNRYEEIFNQQEVSMKMDINLTSLKRLREVQQRNKHLKMKINELKETQALLIQEKELLHPQI